VAIIVIDILFMSTLNQPIWGEAVNKVSPSIAICSAAFFGIGVLLMILLIIGIFAERKLSAEISTIAGAVISLGLVVAYFVIWGQQKYADEAVAKIIKFCWDNAGVNLEGKRNGYVVWYEENVLKTELAKVDNATLLTKTQEWVDTKTKKPAFVMLVSTGSWFVEHQLRTIRTIRNLKE
jgi:hypothetical protein